MERSFRQTMIAEHGNVLAFFERPISGSFMALSILFFLLPIVAMLRKGRKPHLAPAE